MFGKNSVCEEVIGVEVEGEGEAHGIALVEGKADVPKALEHSFVILAYNFHQQFFSLHKIQNYSKRKIHGKLGPIVIMIM